MAKLRAALLAAGILVAASDAGAESFDLTPYDAENTSSLDDADLSHWVNLSRCRCDAQGSAADEATLNLRVVDDSGTYTTDSVFFYLGDDCDSDSVTITEQCCELAVLGV